MCIRRVAGLLSLFRGSDLQLVLVTRRGRFGNDVHRISEIIFINGMLLTVPTCFHVERPAICCCWRCYVLPPVGVDTVFSGGKSGNLRVMKHFGFAQRSVVQRLYSSSHISI